MKIVCISDTHRLHAQVEKIPGDVVIHAGDACGYGSTNELMSFLAWFKNYPCTHKIFVAGNHDRCMELHTFLEEDVKANGIIYLKDSSVTIEDVEFYGTPYQPFFCNWAFNIRDPFALADIYAKIPASTDFLITHCSAADMLDKCTDGHVGSPELQRALKRICPEYHLFGHIHEGYGTREQNGVTYINASQCDEHYNCSNKPIVVEI